MSGGAPSLCGAEQRAQGASALQPQAAGFPSCLDGLNEHGRACVGPDAGCQL